MNKTIKKTIIISTTILIILLTLNAALATWVYQETPNSLKSFPTTIAATNDTGIMNTTYNKTNLGGELKQVKYQIKRTYTNAGTHTVTENFTLTTACQAINPIQIWTLMQWGGAGNMYINCVKSGGNDQLDWKTNTGWNCGTDHDALPTTAIDTIWTDTNRSCYHNGGGYGWENDNTVAMPSIHEEAIWWEVNTTINATDINTGTKINNFNITFSNGTTAEVTDAYIINSTYPTQNITITAENYQPRTYYNWDLNNDLQAELATNPEVFTINIYEPTGTLAAGVTVQINGGGGSSSNPYTENIWNYLANYTDSETVNVTLTHNLYGIINTNITFNITNNTFNITYDEAEVYIYFTQSGSPYNTTGFIATVQNTTSTQNSGIYPFYNTNAVIVQQELPNGQVNIHFNLQNTTDPELTNYTQYYEYINGENYTTINETIEILQNGGWFGYIQVIGRSQDSIENAIIRARYATPTYTYPSLNNWTEQILLGQRLTDSDGYTFFWGDSGTSVLFTITADGYEPKEVLVTFGDEERTKDNALVVQLNEDILNNYENRARIFIKKQFSNRTTNIYGAILAIAYNKIEIQTDYRISQGLGRKDITTLGDLFYRYFFYLEQGVDFSNTGTDNITLSLYLDDTWWKNITIEYLAPEEQTFVFSFNADTIGNNIINALLAIAIILLTIIMQILTHDENIGVATFIIGCIAASFVTVQFLWLTIIGGLYIAIRILRKTTGE